jgi:catechol 2,3-dioxygenase-like lactoylglutathione lyase family enzyme
MRLLEIHLECSDLEEALAFYSQLLPHTRVVWNGPTDPQAFLVLNDGTALGLWQTGTRGIHDGLAGAHVHWALQIAPADFEMYCARIRALGATPLEWLWSDGSRSVYFFDRDGHQGEFMTRDWQSNSGSARQPREGG